MHHSVGAGPEKAAERACYSKYQGSRQKHAGGFIVIAIVSLAVAVLGLFDLTVVALLLFYRAERNLHKTAAATAWVVGLVMMILGVTPI
jgi:hypothetical protein